MVFLPGQPASQRIRFNQEMLTTTTTIKNMIVKAKKSVLTKSGKRIGLFFPSGNQSIVQA